MAVAEDPELEAEARSLLAGLGGDMEAPIEVRERMLRRLSLALPGGPTGDGGAGPPVEGGGGTAPTGSGAAGAGLGGALSAKVPAWALLVSFLAGGAIVGAATSARLRAPAAVVASPAVSGARALEPPAALASATARGPAAPPSASSVAVVEPAPAPVASSEPRAPSAPAKAPEGDKGSLEAERALLDVARTAIGRGDGENALRATAEHARKFPRGALAEEREAMSIQALRLLGKDAEAKAKLDRFRGKYPTSLIRPALEADDAGSP